jgi:PKD repeat protein
VTGFVPVDYHWACIGDDFVERSSPTFSCTYNEPGTYTVTVEAAATSGEMSAMDTIEVTVISPLPPLNERFDNQGQCIREANTNPNAGFTKEDCKAALKT